MENSQNARVEHYEQKKIQKSSNFAKINAFEMSIVTKLSLDALNYSKVFLLYFFFIKMFTCSEKIEKFQFILRFYEPLKIKLN